MDGSSGGNQNFRPRYGNNFEFEAADEGIGFSRLLSGQGVPQGWQSSQNVLGYSHFGGPEATTLEGGTSFRDVDPAPKPQRPREPASQVRQKRVAIRSQNFSEQEDLLLVSAWVNIGHDPIHGTNQSSSTYWGRITEYFHEHSEGQTNERNQKSLTARWGLIQQEVSKFCGYLQQVENRNQSGKTEIDKLDDARRMYEATEKKKFHFIHCYHELKDKAKWKNVVSSKKLKTTATSSPASRDGEEFYVDLEGETGHTVHDDSERPEGTKAAKRRSRSSSSSAWTESALKETADSLNAHFVEAETSRQELMRQQHEKHTAKVARRHEDLLAARREKLSLLREIEEKKLQHKEKMKAMEMERVEKMKAMEIERVEKMKALEFEQTEKLKAMEIELKDKHFRMELDRNELNMILQLDLSKLDDVSRKFYERRKVKLIAKLEEEE